MSKVVRSARGRLVDFDVLKIKSTISATPAPITVAAREQFVDQKLNRRLRRRAQQVPKELLTAPPKEEQQTEDTATTTLPKVKKVQTDEQET